jgi:hypothetical protein
LSRKLQVLIHDSTGVDFARGNLVAVIQDARDIGVQLYANDTGSAFFTLPVDHPALPLIVPLEQQYTIQRQNDSGVYETISGGFISDYDASDQEVVISGVDYMTVLSRYYTPLDGPPAGALAIDMADSVVQIAQEYDETYKEEPDLVPTAGSGDPEAGQINAYSNPAGSPSVGTRNQITVTQDDATGTISVAGNLYIVRRTSNTNKVTLSKGAGHIVGGAPALTAVGFILYSDPGGACALVIGGFPNAAPYNEVFLSGAPTDGDVVLTFRVDLPYVGNGAPSGTAPGGAAIGRTSPVIYKGVPYKFAVHPFVVADFVRYENADNTNNTYYTNVDATTGALLSNATAAGSPASILKTAPGVFQIRMWGDKSDYTTAATTSGIKRKNINDIVADIYPKVIDRTADYSDSVGTLPKALIAWQSSVNHVNSGSSTTLHPYITFGQDPVEFFREVSDLETSSRGGTIGVNPDKVVFNYYGVPGGTEGQLTFNHNVSASPAHTYVYPGQIKSYNFINKRSVLANSVRVLPTTDFLVGASSDAPSGARTKGVVKSDRTLAYALPHVEAQPGFINTAAATNYAQGVLNDRGTVEDTKILSVTMRSGTVSPIGTTGGPRLGETVRLIVRRKNVDVNGADSIATTYNIGGMQYLAHMDGHEETSFDFVKPSKFKGPGISFDMPMTKYAERRDTRVPQDSTKKKKVDQPGGTPPGGNPPGGNPPGGNPPGGNPPGLQNPGGFNQSWWGPGGPNNIDNLNDPYNIQPGRGGAMDHFNYVNSHNKPNVQPGRGGAADHLNYLANRAQTYAKANPGLPPFDPMKPTKRGR